MIFFNCSDIVRVTVFVVVVKIIVIISLLLVTSLFVRRSIQLLEITLKPQIKADRTLITLTYCTVFAVCRHSGGHSELSFS